MDDFLQSRIDDMLDRCQRGEAAHSGFLNETERAEVTRYLSGKTGELEFDFFGGYKDAERTRLFIYPYYYDLSDLTGCIRAVKLTGSGYAVLRHSSFLGALTSLGIDRAKMGDIVMQNDGAVLFCDEAIFRFLISSPDAVMRVGRDTVKLAEFIPDPEFCNVREFKDHFDTVASPRLDAVVGSLASLPREKAKSAVLRGDVQVNHLVQQKCDHEISDGDTVTVRSVGKFIIVSLADKTRKDRYKLIAKKYI